MTRKYSSISVETTLASGINATQTTMTVPNSNAATLLLGGQTLGDAVGGVYPDIFTVVIDPDTASEEVVFVQNVNGSTLVISRAQAGTGQTPGSTGIDHAAGATVRHVLTSSDLDFFRNGVATADAAIPKTIVDAKGDLIVATAADTPARLAVGSTNGQALTVDSTTATGLAWATINSTPRTGQIVSTAGQLNTSTSSNSYVDLAGLSLAITPTLSTSKVLVIVSFNIASQGAPNAISGAQTGLLRGSTLIADVFGYNLLYSATLSNTITNYNNVSFAYLDSPATTSATTYKVQWRKTSSAVDAQAGGAYSMILQEVLV